MGEIIEGPTTPDSAVNRAAIDGGGASPEPAGTSSRPQEFGIAKLGTIPAVKNPYPPPRQRGIVRAGERWQRMRQLFYLKGEGLYKEEDSRVVNTIAYAVAFLVVLAAATYLVFGVVLKSARETPAKSGPASFAVSAGLHPHNLAAPMANSKKAEKSPRVAAISR